jgi:hypothetical protein
MLALAPTVSPSRPQGSRIVGHTMAGARWRAGKRIYGVQTVNDD